ncbi:MAG TPA: site-specific DNA-methyltransferase [Natrialbaceae archaeon]|nr:site-specific DNA-methyltransferase [Natrialbaceae archaeon]
METEHVVHVDDARSMGALEDDSIDLVVTSPPYPMIELWDETFEGLDPEIGDRLDAGDGWGAYERMHGSLDPVWDEVGRVLRPGGIACINVGDATRSIGGEFRRYPNHERVLRALRERGLRPLPDVLWRKPTNRATKFMGSGMLPPNAYVTLEHEYVLVFRNGGLRSVDDGERRHESAYFWEERNEWFSDVWTDLTGTLQALGESAAEAERERSGAFPFELPHRLINMYSVYGDRVLDPFWGTGTTTLAAMVAGRNSVGYELDEAFVDAFDDRVDDVPTLSRTVTDERLDDHRSFVADRRESGDEPKYEAQHYDFRVVTRQERSIRLYDASTVERNGDSPRRYAVEYEPR